MYIACADPFVNFGSSVGRGKGPGQRRSRSIGNPGSHIEPGLVLLCLLELRATTARTVTLACNLDDVPRRLRPHARPDGDLVRIPRAAALAWVEHVAQRLGPAMGRAHARSTDAIRHHGEAVAA